jgi:hypothetical protein
MRRWRKKVFISFHRRARHDGTVAGQEGAAINGISTCGAAELSQRRVARDPGGEFLLVSALQHESLSMIPHRIPKYPPHGSRP